jgi:hypothetical protein
MTMSKFISAALICFTSFIPGSLFSQDSSFRIAQASSGGIKPMTYADLERLYLDGKISAKQYQRLLNELKSRPPAAAAPAQAQPPNATAPARSTNAPPPAILSKDDKINEVENKMDELIRAKAAREKATNVTTRPATAGPKTKRERLNDLLRLYIEGKISETDLNERRAKILAEPD